MLRLFLSALFETVKVVTDVTAKSHLRSSQSNEAREESKRPPCKAVSVLLLTSIQDASEEDHSTDVVFHKNQKKCCEERTKGKERRSREEGEEPVEKARFIVHAVRR